MGSKFGDDDDDATRTVLAGGRTAHPTKRRRLTPSSDSAAQPKHARNNTLVGEKASRNCSRRNLNDMLSHTDAGEQQNNLDQYISLSEDSEEEVVCLDSLGITEEEDHSEDDFCVKCSEGGNLLVCSNGGCPISAHKKCMNCPAMYDKLGNFYCPLCSCRIAEKKLALAKTYLSLFVAKETVDGDLQEQSPKRVKIEKPSPSTPNNGLDYDQIHDQIVQVKKDQEEERYKKCGAANISPRKGMKASEIAARIDNVPCSSADHARPNGRDDQHGTETVQLMQEETLVDPEVVFDCDESGNHNFQIKKDQKKDRDKYCCTRSASPHVGAETSEIDVRAENVPCGTGDLARTNDGNQQRTEAVQKIHEETLIGAEDGLDCVEIRNPNVDFEKGKKEERDKKCCTTSISPAIGAEASDIAALTDNEPCKSVQHKTETVQEETLSACDSIDQVAYREEAGHNCEDLHDGQTVSERVFNGRQNENVFQNEQQIGHSNSDGVHEAAILNDDLLTVTGKETENRKTVKERGEGVQEDRDTRMFKGGNSIEHDQERPTDSNQRHPDAPSPPALDCHCPRQKASNLISEKAKVAAKKSSGYVSTGLTCKKRHRKLAWTAEEEKKLKEGVDKFMGIVRKNIPWRKILQFGAGVFDPSRTSDDLKDKWRTMNGMRTSAPADHVEPPAAAQPL